MKSKTAGIFGWLLSEKIELIGDVCIDIIFLVYRIYCKADGVVSCAILVKWCLLKYMNFIKTLAIIVRCSLNTYCNSGFRHYVSPCI